MVAVATSQQASKALGPTARFAEEGQNCCTNGPLRSLLSSRCKNFAGGVPDKSTPHRRKAEGVLGQKQHAKSGLLIGNPVHKLP